MGQMTLLVGPLDHKPGEPGIQGLVDSELRRLVVLGGSRMIGSELVVQAAMRGFSVTVFNRGSSPPDGFPPGVEHIQGDRGDEGALEELARRHPDAVIDLSCYEPDHVRISLSVFVGRCATYVLMSSGAVYQSQELLPWNEDVPLGGDPLWGEYGRKKLENEKLAHQFSNQLRIVTPRAPYVLGALDHMKRLEFIFERVVNSKTVVLPDTGMACIQFVGARDVAAACLHLVSIDLPADTPVAFNVAPFGFTTLRGLVDLVAAEVGISAKIVAVDLEAVGLSNMPFSWTDMVFPFADRHFLLDGRRLESRGFVYQVSIEDMVREAAKRFVPEESFELYPAELRARRLLGIDD